MEKEPEEALNWRVRRRLSKPTTMPQIGNNGTGLFHDRTRNPRSATAKRDGGIGVIIAAGMDYHRVALHFGDSEMGRCHRLSCPSIGIDSENGQVALVAFATFRSEVLSSLHRIEMTARRKTCGFSSALVAGTTIGVRMDVKAVTAGRQAR